MSSPLLDRYIVFDVETPNSKDMRISAIGIEVVEGGRIVQEFSTLINPETYFNWYNTKLTGISEKSVRNKPTFPELWPTIEPLLSSGLLVAHNAAFDMRMLSGCLADYGIYWKDSADYLCTVCMGRKVYPDFPNHRLDTMCDMLGIPLYHHRAGSDSRACALLLLDYLGAGLDPAHFIRTKKLV